jgi:hypothetical protein
MSEPAAPPPADDHVVEPAVLNKSIRRSARHLYGMAAALVLGGAALGAGATYLTLRPAHKEAHYTAYVKLFIQRDPEQLLSREPRLTDAQFDSLVRTQVALLRDRAVLYAALRDKRVKPLNLEAEARNIPVVEWLEKGLKVDFPEGPEIMRVSLDGDDPEVPKALVAAVVDAYLEEYSNDLTQRREERIKKLEGIRDNYKRLVDGLRKKRDELNKLVGLNADKAIAGRQALREKRVERVQTDLVKADADLRRLEIERKLAEAREGEKSRLAMLDEQITFNRELKRTLEDTLAQLEKAKNDEASHIIGFDDGKKDLEHAEERLAVVNTEIDKAKVEKEAPSRVQKMGGGEVVVVANSK